MKTMICDLKIFDFKQIITIIDSETGAPLSAHLIQLASFAKEASEFCNNQNISKIILSGNKQYGDKLAQDIIEHSKIHYSNNNLEIEVI